MAPYRFAACVAIAVLSLGPPVRAGVMGAGTQERDWLDGEPQAARPYERHVVNLRDDIRIAMSDGVELDARLFEPALPDGPGPCILVANGYGNNTGAGAMWEPWFFDLASAGYALLHVSLRDSGESGGSNDLYNHYGRDGYELVEWMAAEPWCNGEVGMVGESLLGISQWLTARQAPPHLKAITPITACGDCYGVLWYPGGLLPGPGREERTGLPIDGVENEYATAIQHRDLDAWWRERVTLAEDHRAMAERGLAAFITAGHEDYVSQASVRAYSEYGGRDAPKRLIFGPWSHSVGSTPLVRNLVAEFLDHRLLAAEGAHTRPKVLLFVSGPDRWRREADWPLPDQQLVRLHLSGKRSRSIESASDRSLSVAEPGAAAPVDIAYDPERGPFLPAMLGRTGRPTLDQTPWSAALPTWTSKPLRRPTELTGTPRLSVRVSASAADADLVASLVEVFPDGSSKLITEGFVNLPRASDPARPQPLEPGVPARYEFEFFPISRVVDSGHRLRLTLAGGVTPAPDQYSPQGPGKHPAAFTLTVHHEAEDASWLELPVVGTLAAPLAVD